MSARPDLRWVPVALASAVRDCAAPHVFIVLGVTIPCGSVLEHAPRRTVLHIVYRAQSTLAVAAAARALSALIIFTTEVPSVKGNAATQRLETAIE